MKVKNNSDRIHRFTDYFTRGPVRPRTIVWGPGEVLDVEADVANQIVSAHPSKMEFVVEAPATEEASTGSAE